MSREIKFRFFDGEKICPVGELTFFEGGGYNINEEFPSTGKDPYPLMQYTGLKDKNGVEIYESDEVRWGAGKIGEVYFEKGRFWVRGFYVSHFDDPSDAFGEGIGMLEVIGNIYSNPELLTQQKEV